MRRVSLKRQRIERKMKAARQAYLVEFPRCMIGLEHRADCVHEMACGSHREAAYQDDCTWLSVCTTCNCYQLTDYAKWPLERQLALKWIHDRGRFDLAAFNLLRGRRPGAIAMAAVIPWICRELDCGQ